MKNLCKILLSAVLTICSANFAAAQVQFGVPKIMVSKGINISFFDNYYPLGKDNYGVYTGLFDTFMKDFQEMAKFSPSIYWKDDYQTTVRTGAKGQSDILFGMYTDTPIYEDWKFIYPAAIDNPVHLVMLPERIGEIKSISDLKKLKGAVDAREQWSDFVSEQISSLNVEKVDNSYDLYGKLMRGEIDYIFTTYWFGMVEMMKLGVSDMLGISKKSIWNMPVFIGVSKTSREREYLVHNLTKLMQNQQVRDKIKSRAIEILEQIRQETQGVVPPSYVLEQPVSRPEATQEEASAANGNPTDNDKNKSDDDKNIIDLGTTN